MNMQPWNLKSSTRVKATTFNYSLEHATCMYFINIVNKRWFISLHVLLYTNNKIKTSKGYKNHNVMYVAFFKHSKQKISVVVCKSVLVRVMLINRSIDDIP